LSERRKLLASMASTIADYRVDDLAAPTPEHVERWAAQFDKTVRLDLLRELDYVLRKTYYSRERIRSFLAELAEAKELAGTRPREFWADTSLLDIQQSGHSQTEMLGFFTQALKSKYDLTPGATGGKRRFVYLDDGLFSGSHVGTDLSSWLRGAAPNKAHVHIIVIASHQLGEWQCLERLKKEAAAVGKVVGFDCWRAVIFENRKRYRDTSEVLWPAMLPDDEAVRAYLIKEQKYPFEPRKPGGTLKQPIFSSESGRQLIEREMLLAGAKINSFSREPSPALRPLGFSAFGLGFGTMLVTYRNCPNNCPLALWWGDPLADKSHPFSKWYPLVPRKTYDGA
jgi:hypothetical protein